MNRSQKITLAVSSLVVVGLVALVAPAVVSLVPVLSATPSEVPALPATEAPTAEPPVDPDDEPRLSAESEEAGIIYAGNGTWFSAEGPGDCTTNAAIHPYGAGDPRAKLAGELTDMGASEFASGEVGYDADGLIETYTVEPGDTLIGIGERFCVDYVTVGAYNDRFGPTVIQPGDVLVLRP